MTNKDLAKNIVTLLGEKDNITNVLHCVTRLRFNIKNEDIVKLNEIEELDGVIGVQVKNGQHQIIIGPMVADIFAEVELLLNSNINENREKTKISGEIILDVITGIFSSILPALVAGGMLKGIIALIDGFKLVPTNGGTFVILNMIADIPFYFLPFLLAISTSKKFKVNEYLGICVAGALLYPSFMEVLKEGATPITFLGINMPIFNYSNSVFPIILGVGLLAIVYHFIDRFVPNVLKIVLVPTITLVVTVPITLLFLAPLGAYGGQYLANSIVWLFSTFGPIAGFLLGFFMPLIVLCGMHQSTSPIQISNIATLGYDYLLPISFCHNMAESGAALGAALRMKDQKLRSAALTTSFSAFLGISEPALFTVQVVHKKPLIAAMTACGIGGAMTTLLSVKCFAFVMPGITSLPVYANPNGIITNLLLMVVCISSTFVIAVVLSYMLSGRIDDKKERVTVKLVSPVKGDIISLNKVNDKTFASGMMGKGFAVIPKDDYILAPCDGEVILLANTLHAVGIKCINGAEILIHVGIDTVELDGKYFESMTYEGKKIKKGDKLLKVDFSSLEKEGYDIIVPVICTNSDLYKDIKIDENNDEILTID